MESLDLNIGFESIQKLQDDWFGGGKKKKEAVKEEQFERDSLDSDKEEQDDKGFQENKGFKDLKVLDKKQAAAGKAPMES